MDMSLCKLWELVMDREAWRQQSMGLQRVGDDWAAELNSVILELVKFVTQEFSIYFKNERANALGKLVKGLQLKKEEGREGGGRK